MQSDEIQALEREIFEKTHRLNVLRAEQSGNAQPVDNYTFETAEGPVSLLALFGDRDRLILIHNMGQGCRYCTLWGDGLNPFVPHLESVVALAMVSKDAPDVQRRFANDRGWRFRMASHGGGRYMKERISVSGEDNVPGAACYRRQGDSITCTGSTMFGPGDLYCSAWHFLTLAGVGFDAFTPQYHYWQRPAQMDDGGQNLPD